MIFQDPMSSLNPVLKAGFQIEEAMKAHDRFTNGAGQGARAATAAAGAHP